MSLRAGRAVRAPRHTRDVGTSPAIAATIAKNVAEQRQRMLMSVSELARRSGVSKATILAIEFGSGNPTVDTLAAIATSLQTTVPDLVTERAASSGPIVIRATDGIWRDFGTARLRLMTSMWSSDVVHVVTTEFDTEGYHHDGHEVGAIECMLVVAGSVIVTYGEHETHELTAGDWIEFDASVPHGYRATLGTAHTIKIVRRTRTHSDWSPDERAD